jgi:outer membrane receptor protein involved in Fe transport
MLKAFRGVLLAVTMALVLSAPLVAQGNTGNVYGNVIDEQGGAIPGGTATLIGPAAPRTTSVDAQGFFRFLNTAPGKYSVTVTMPGFTTVTRENVQVKLGQNTQVDVQLRLSDVQESVTVTSETPLIDPRKVETGETFGKDQLTEIPTSRDVWSLIQQVPGVQINTVNVAGNQSALAGGPEIISKGSGNVVYQIDGATVTNNTWGDPFGRQNGGTDTFFDFSTFENVEVATGGSTLDQQSSGATINVVTKRGTNEIRGSARYNYASHDWQSNNTPEEAVVQGLPTNNTQFVREYGGELGGPIVKDRLWLWFAGSYQTIDLNTGTFDSSYGAYSSRSATNLEPWSAKLNGQISNSNSAAMYYSRSYRTQSNRGAAPDRPPDTLTNLLIPANFYKVEDSNVFSADLFGSAFVSYYGDNYDSQPLRGIHPNDENFQLQYWDNSWQNNWVYFISKNPQKQANAQASKFFNTGKLNHELKVSFNYRQQINDSASGLPGNQLQGYYASSSSQSALIGRGVRSIYKTQLWSGSLGDTITTGNLTVQVGVRYDQQQAKNLPSTSFENTAFPVLLPEVKYHGAQDWQFDFTTWQPRVSATYALGEKKNTLLRASYARFADQMGYLGYYGSGVPQANGYYVYWNDSNGDRIVQASEADPSIIYSFYSGLDPAVMPNLPNTIVPGLKTPTSNEFTAGIDQEIGSNFAVSGTFSYRNTNELLQQLTSGATLSSYQLTGIANGTAVAANGFTLPFAEPFYGLNNLASPATGVTLSNRPGATQRFYGVDVSLQKRLSDNWMLRVNGGWNSFKQYLQADSIQNPNNLQSLGGQNDNGGLVVGGSNGRNGKGFVQINSSWQFSVNGLYQGPYGISLGANLFGRQGYPNPYYVRAYSNEDALDGSPIGSRNNILIDQVNTYRNSDVYQLDLRLQKSFQIGGVTIIPAAELFNVANSAAILQRYQRVGTYNRGDDNQFEQDSQFNQIIEVQSPRIVRLGITVSF